MKETKILVTGCCGFMGSWVAEALQTKGYDVYGIDDLSGGFLNNWRLDEDKLFIGDLSEYSAQKVIKDLAPEVIFHLAASAREGASQFDPTKITRTNYWAYIKTLETAISTGNLKKVVMFSSMAVYGNQPTPFNESLERKPVDIYGINKAIMEQSTEILADIHEFNYTIIRPHNVFGVRQCLTDPYRNVIAIIMSRILKKEPIYIYGDGEQIRAFSYIKDSIDCYIKCLDDETNGKIYNIGGKVPITINELTNLIIEEFKEYDKPEIIYLPERPCEVKVAYSTHELSEKDLEYKEEVGFKEGIKRMARWAKNIYKIEGGWDWNYEDLAIINEKTPKTWREKL